MARASALSLPDQRPRTNVSYFYGLSALDVIELMVKPGHAVEMAMHAGAEKAAPDPDDDPPSDNSAVIVAIVSWLQGGKAVWIADTVPLTQLSY